MSEAVSVARAAWYAGLSVLPAEPTTKRPAEMVGRWKDYETERPPPHRWKEWASRGVESIGICCGAAGVEAIDFDLAGAAYEAWARLVEERQPGLLGRCYIERSPSGGRHVIYRCPDEPAGNAKLATWWIDVREREAGERITVQRHGVDVTIEIVTDDTGRLCWRNAGSSKTYRIAKGGWASPIPIETRGSGGWLVVAPTAGYTVEQGRLQSLPQLCQMEHEILIEAARAIGDEDPRQSSTTSIPADSVGASSERPGDRYTREGDHRALLERHGWTYTGEHAGKDGEPNEAWRRPGKADGLSATWAIHHRVFYVFTDSVPELEAEHGYSLFDLLARLEHNGDHRAAARALATEYRGNRRPQRPQRPVDEPDDWDIDPRGSRDGEWDEDAADPPADEPEKPRRRGDPELWELNEHGNALRFYDCFGDRVRYCRTWGVWLCWVGTHWEQDPQRANRWMREAIVDTVDEQLETIGRVDYPTKETKKQADAGDQEAISILAMYRSKNDLKNWRLKQQNNRALVNSLSQASNLAELLVDADDLDSHRHLLSVENGTVDLRTGELQPHDPAHLITRHCPLVYDPRSIETAAGQRWLQFMDELTDGDESITGFLQRFAGYTMTGDTSEQAFLFLHGPGGTGKSTFAAATSAILGSYADTVPFKTFLDSTSSDQYILAGISQARMVLSEEAPEGQKFASEVIKMVTGKAKIKAAHKYGNPFSYMPEFKLWLVSNDLPPVSDTDSGFWRRCRLVRCDHLPKVKDRKLIDYLCEDPEARRAILSWLVAGASAWHAQGLDEPAQVRQWSEEYRRQQDPVGDFFDERCSWRESESVTREKLRKVYIEFCKENEIRPLGPKKFNERLRARGASETWITDDQNGGRQRGWMGVRDLHHLEIGRTESGSRFGADSVHGSSDGVETTLFETAEPTDNQSLHRICTESAPNRERFGADLSARNDKDLPDGCTESPEPPRARTGGTLSQVSSAKEKERDDSVIRCSDEEQTDRPPPPPDLDGDPDDLANF